MDPTDTLSIDPLSALPAPWLAAVQHYAPTVLAWLLIATVLVHLLVPIARAVERWAVASSVTWDDGPARKFAEVIEWLAGALRAVLAFLPRLAIGGIGQRDVKPANVSHPSERGTRARPTMVPPPKPPSSNAGLAIALIIFGAALSVAVSACSTGPQIVPQTTPINIACTWTNADGGVIEDCDCMVDRATSGADATTQGNVIRDNTVTPTVTTEVSGIPGS